MVGCGVNEMKTADKEGLTLYAVYTSTCEVDSILFHIFVNFLPYLPFSLTLLPLCCCCFCNIPKTVVVK